MIGKTELLLRLMTALFLMTLFGAALYFGGWVYYALVVLAVGAMAYEFKAMHPKYILVLLPVLFSAIWLRQFGYEIILWVTLVIVATDTGGYFFGKKYGNKKLAPSISPNKTIEGAVGGIALAIIITVLFNGSVLLGFIFSILAIAGDLFESWVKRKYGVKDSGTLLPGHGGVLDRLDGFLFAIPAAAILVYLEVI